MKAPPSIASAARARLRAAAAEVRHSLTSIDRGRPGDAETDASRRSAVVQARRRVSPGQARRLARSLGPEAVWGDTVDFVDVVFLERGVRAARSVCRISTRSGQGIGTGFLISPRLLLTNNHVIGSAAEAADLVAEFDYERDLLGLPRPVTRFAFAPAEAFVTDHRDALDFSVVALGPRTAGARSIAAFAYLPLSAAGNKHALGDIVNIIQHPDGRMKEAVVRENQLVSRSATALHYVADTEPGASGSPVFNVLWNVIALHHWGGPHRELFDEKGVRVPRTVNEGIRASAIVRELETRKAGLSAPARQAVEEALRLGLSEAAPDPGVESPGTPILGVDRSGASVSIAADGVATWRIPLTVSVSLGAAPAIHGERPGAASPGGEARLEPDEDYDNRGGYEAAFLGTAVVPLPRLSAAQKRVAAKNKERREGDDPHELKYEHFSAVLHGKRRLAFFTATNIDGSLAKDVDRATGVVTAAAGPDEDDEAAEGAEASERWFPDPRLEDEQQTPPDFYEGQTTFDAAGRPITNRQGSDHRNRMFQQGHLTRRQDPLWGPDDVVVRAHADTFHVTNRAPQVGYFNMGTRKRGAEAGHPGGTLHWRALEDYVLENARADRARVSVFTGPIFDEGRDFAWSRGRADMRGFKAPRAYWKLVLRVEGGALRATALLADQSPLIDFLPELLDVGDQEARRIAFDKVEKYQLSVAELQRRTGLKFGASVVSADTFVPGGGGDSAKKRAFDVEDLSLGYKTARPRKPRLRGRRPPKRKR